MIERYDPATHYEMLCEWWRGHGCEPPRLEHLPMHGFIVDGCVAGFMYLTETKAALAEHMVGRPGAGRKLVAAIGVLTGAIVELARSLGFTAIITNTKSSFLAKHCGVLGANVTPRQTIYRCTLAIGGNHVGRS